MKKIFLAIAALVLTATIFAAAPYKVNEKVLSAFSKTFQNVSKVVWQEYPDYYEVRFLQGDIDNRIMYDMQGNIVQSVRYYFQKELPLFIKAKLQSRFPDKKVYGVTEITKESELTYYIILEDEKTWTNIQSDYFGSMTIQKKYKKA